MRTITLEELLDAGCHFGHQVNRRNPKADEFIFEERDRIHVINLEKTHEGLLKAAEYLKDLSSKGGKIIIVGTKRQVKPVVDEEVARIKEAGVQGVFYITERWIGGTLTNFDEVSKNFKKLKDIRSFLAAGKTTGYTKRELLEMAREKAKLERFYGGIENLSGAPDALLVIDTNMEDTAISEAIAMGVDTVGIVDTNADPTIIDYPIPANDDAVGSVSIILSYLVDAWIEGQKGEIKEEKTESKTDGDKTTPKKTRKKKEEVAETPVIA